MSLALNQKLQNCFIIIQTISRIKKIMSKTVESYWGLSQIVFGLRCGGGTSGKVPRHSLSRREAINWALGVDLEPAAVSSERKRQDG